MANTTSIKITIEAPALAEAIVQLADAIKGNKLKPVITDTLEPVFTGTLETAPAPVPITAPAAAPQYEQFVPNAPAPQSVPVQAPTAPVMPPVNTAPNIPPAPAPVPQMSQQPIQTPPAVNTVPVQPAVPDDYRQRVVNAGARLVDRGMMPQVTALLASFGVNRATDLKPEQLGAFAQGLIALGAQI